MAEPPQRFEELDLLVGNLLNDDLDMPGMRRLSELLACDVEAQKRYVRCLSLEAAVRTQAQLLDDDDFAVLEAQVALDAPTAPVLEAGVRGNGDARFLADAGTVELALNLNAAPNHRLRRLRRRPWRTLAAALAAAVVLFGSSIAVIEPVVSDRSSETAQVAANAKDGGRRVPHPARLSGAVGARWAGAKLELPEGELFNKGQWLELVEGLAEICFHGGARLVVQGPAIVEIRDENSARISVGRIGAVVPKSAPSFSVRTLVADLTSREAEFGAEVDVDGSVATQVYKGDVELLLKRGATSSADPRMSAGEGLRVDALSGRVGPLTEHNRLHFVRYLPQHETLISLADVVAGGSGFGDSTRTACHRGISLTDGRQVHDYGAPAAWDGQYRSVRSSEFVDGVFIPNGGRGPVQLDSIGRTFSNFPATAGDCWGGAIMARRPQAETSLPQIRLEFHGDNYGYVNWLHIASKAEELCPQGHGLIGMHSNCGITFDLHAVRARHSHKKLLRFRSLVGNLESQSEVNAADAWVLVDGQLRWSRKKFNREHGLQAVEIPLTDTDRFLVLVVTDAGANTAYDWIAFGDAVLEMTNLEGMSASADVLFEQHQSSNHRERTLAIPQHSVSAHRERTSVPEFGGRPLVFAGVAE